MNITLNKIFIMLVKYMPMVQIMGIFINNILYINEMYYSLAIVKYIFGGSINLSIFLLLTSYIYDFCIWHRLLILTNLINNTVSIYNVLYKLNDNSIKIIFLLIIIYSFLIVMFTISHLIKIKYKNELKNKINKELVSESNRTD